MCFGILFLFLAFHGAMCVVLIGLQHIAEALQLVVSECKPKTKIVDLCEKGDAFIRE